MKPPEENWCDPGFGGEIFSYETRSTWFPKGNPSWIFIGRTDAEAETPILWPPDVKGWVIWKDPDAGKDWKQEEKGTTEDEMVGWHHWLNGLKSEQALGVVDGQWSLVCCSPWGHKEWDMTERLNWKKKKIVKLNFVNSRSWWWTGRPGLLWFMGSHRVGHDWATELNWTENYKLLLCEWNCWWNWTRDPLLPSWVQRPWFPICRIMISDC